ncbi:unnamed protein product [Closterium sp. NIES-54]
MVQHVLQRFSFTYSSPQSTSLPTGHSLSAPPSDESVEPSGPYPELVGCLMYLMTCTRPDLAYPPSLQARHVALGRHRKVHWDTAKRVLRYLCITSGMGLVLGGWARVVLTGLADALWRSTRSSSVLSSSCEAEIYAGAMAAQELRWLTYLLTDLGEAPRSPPVLYVDNKAMLALCQEHRLEHRTKHIALRYFLARELQQRGQLRLAYVASQANTANVLRTTLLCGDFVIHPELALPFLTGLWQVIVTLPRAYEPPSQEEEPTGPSFTWSSFCETAQYSACDAWCAGLWARFELITASISARQKLHTRRQLGSFQDYTSSFLALCEHVGHEAEWVDRYVDRLKSDISHEIMLRGQSSFNEILALAEKIDILRQQRLGARYAAPATRSPLAHGPLASPAARSPLACGPLAAPAAHLLPACVQQATLATCLLPAYGPLAAPCSPLAAPCGPLAAPCSLCTTLRQPARRSFACPPCCLHRPAPARPAAGHPSHALPCPACFDTWLDEFQLYLLSDSIDNVSLFDHMSGASLTPPTSADSATRSHWHTCDAAARLAIHNHLPLAECAHFGQHKTAKALYDAVVASYSSPATAALGHLILPYLFPELSSFATLEDLVTHLRTSDTRYRAALPAELLDKNAPPPPIDAHYRAALPAEFLDKNPPPMYITLNFIVTCLPDSLRAVRDHFLALDPTDLTVDVLEQHLLAAETSVVAVDAARGTPRTPFFEGCSPSPLAPSYASAADVDVLGAEDVGAASTSAKRRSSKGKGGRSGGGGSGGGIGGGSGGGGGCGGRGSGRSGGGSGGFGGGGGGSGGSGGSGSGGSQGGAVHRGGSGSG